MDTLHNICPTNDIRLTQPNPKDETDQEITNTDFDENLGSLFTDTEELLEDILNYTTEDEEYINLSEAYNPKEEPSPELAPQLDRLISPTPVPNMKIPSIGQTFTNIEQAYDFYLDYAKYAGFGIVKRNSRSNEEGVQTFLLVTCQKGSRPKRSPALANPNRKRAIVHTGCTARLVVNCDKKTQILRVTKFEPNHNHILMPNHARFMRSHQKLPVAVQVQLQINDEAGVPIHKSIDIVHTQNGGPQNCMYTANNMRRHIEKTRSLKLGEGDAQALRAYFDKMQQQSPDFFSSCSWDNEGRLLNVFWADGRSRGAFKEFGQVVTFDSTYLTNKYNMSFAMFVTGNQHQQSLMLAAVLLADETIENYQWVFKKFKDCMMGQTPEAIITDQCPAIMKAIELEFPQARHRLCLWHVMKKLPTKMGPLANNNGAVARIQNVVYDSLNEAEFEQNWTDAINDFNLSSNDWLTEIHKLAPKWVPAFVRHSFWAGMSTTQRSESMNAFFDGYVNSKTSLKLFVTRVEDAMKDKREKEAEEDYCSMANSQEMITTTPYELQASKCYTRTILKQFRQETITLANCFVNNMTSHENSYVMEVCQFGSSRVLLVQIDFQAKKVECECHLFEFKGYLCCHALCAMRQLKIMVIPNEYIIKRWRKDCLRSYMYIALSTGPVYRNMDHYNELFRKCYSTMLDIVELASCNDTAADEVVQGFNQILKNISGACPLKEAAFFANPNGGNIQTNKRQLNNRGCIKQPSTNQVRQTIRSLETYAITPIAINTKRTAAIETQNGVTQQIGSELIIGEITTPVPFVALNPPCSPRSGRPPALRKKRMRALDQQRLNVIRQLQQHPHMETFRAWNAPQNVGNMELLRQMEVQAQMQNNQE